jgi:hypothetical protein
MTLRPRGRNWLALACLVIVLAPGVAARAQNFPGPLNNLTGGGILPLPPPPPQGAFFEVIFANPKWVVVQNERGQQFPVAADLINQFLIRWQADIRDLNPAVLVEAVGPEVIGMTIQTNHIDLYMGSDQVLVKPGYTSVLPIGRPVIAIDPTYQRNMTGYDIAAQNQLYSWVYPTVPGDNGIPGLMHLVGNAINVNPLRLGVPGNNFVNVLPPSPGVMTMTQVTMGQTGFAGKGDFAYLTPVQGRAYTDKSLVIAQVVLYKKMRRDQFVP